MEFEKEYFPTRHIRLARGKFIILIESQLGLGGFAEHLAREIIESHLSTLNKTAFKEYISKLEITEDEIDELFCDNRNLTVDDVLDIFDDPPEIIKIALNLGVDGLFANEHDSETDRMVEIIHLLRSYCMLTPNSYILKTKFAVA